MRILAFPREIHSITSWQALLDMQGTSVNEVSQKEDHYHTPSMVEFALLGIIWVI